MQAAAKRAFDLFVAIVGLAVLSPVLGLIAIAVKLDSPGPVFFRGVRVGIGGGRFRIFKFRSMVPEAEYIGGSTTRLADPRITRVGAVLRRYKLDELPQLISVLNGTMSLVGPRPEVEEYTRLYSNEEQAILSVRPGITDYASIRFVDLASEVGSGDADTEYRRRVLEEKNRLRLKYVRERSLSGDVAILIATARTLFGQQRHWNT